MHEFIGWNYLNMINILKNFCKKKFFFQRQGKPYCNQCYSAMFGPQGYGHGGSESHTFHNGLTGKAN